MCMYIYIFIFIYCVETIKNHCLHVIVHTHTYTYIYMHACIHTYIHKHIYICMWVFVCMLSFSRCINLEICTWHPSAGLSLESGHSPLLRQHLQAAPSPRQLALQGRRELQCFRLESHGEPRNVPKKYDS